MQRATAPEESVYPCVKSTLRFRKSKTPGNPFAGFPGVSNDYFK
ncbi:hypothetical protein EV649_0626 [Kribbella sp. VKM Ac-2569]|nr:hypothetical protein EV649_0626 [Kribbella sp. VKM Ac-2569]